MVCGTIAAIDSHSSPKGKCIIIRGKVPLGDVFDVKSRGRHKLKSDTQVGSTGSQSLCWRKHGAWAAVLPKGNRNTYSSQQELLLSALNHRTAVARVTCFIQEELGMCQLFF